MIRVAWAVAFAATLLTPAVVSLSTRVEDVRDAPLARARAGWVSSAVALVADKYDPAVVRLSLYTRDVDAVLRRPEISVAFATFGPSLELVRGLLHAGGCTYATADGTRVANNADVRFVRQRECRRAAAPAGGVRAIERLTPVMRLARPAPLVVWTFTPRDPPPDESLVFVGAPPGSAASVPALRGRYVDARGPSPVRRRDLLAYVWQLGARGSWIAGMVAFAGIVFAAGGVAFATSIARAAAPSRGSSAAAAGAMALGVEMSAIRTRRRGAKGSSQSA